MKKFFTLVLFLFVSTSATVLAQAPYQRVIIRGQGQSQTAAAQASAVPQPPAPKIPLLQTGAELFEYLGDEPVAVTQPQYLTEGHGNAFGGYYILGARYQFGTIGNIRDVASASFPMQKELEHKLRLNNLNLLGAITGAGAFETATSDAEFGSGKNGQFHGPQSKETAVYVVQASYAFGISQRSIKSLDGRVIDQMARETARIFDGKTDDLIKLGGKVVSKIGFHSDKIDLRAVMYITVKYRSRQIAYTETVMKDFTVSEAKFWQILGVGVGSQKTLGGQDIAAELVKEAF